MGAGPRFVETTRDKTRAARGESRAEPVVVLAHHARLARAGETLALGPVTEISRLAPSFVAPDGSDAGPLDDPFVSRQPFAIRRVAHGVTIDNPHGIELVVGGVRVDGSRRVSFDELARGIDIVVGDRVVLWLGDGALHEDDDLGLAGCSAAIAMLRAEIREAAKLSGPFLVTGETGSGKELVARAIHACGPRARGPFVAVNVAAIPAAVAAAELFGHERGAFTGAGERRTGYFERADGGVLFLDEIGELPESVQPVLLRALESGEVQPVGGQPRRVDVAIVAATDADLERSVKRPLYYRLAATTLHVPPLRERGPDVGILLARFALPLLAAHLLDQTAEADARPAASTVAQMMRRPWPGNVRELRSAASQIAMRIAAGKPIDSDLGGFDEAPHEPDVAHIDDARLIATLREHRFQLSRTAEALGISRTHLDALIARSGKLRKAKDLTRDEIAAALEDDIDAMAAKLEVSPRGLRLRMRQLGI